MAGNIRNSPRYITAKNEKELQKKMLLLQLQTSREYSWLTIYPIKGGVVGWYYGTENFERIIGLDKALER